MSRRDHSLLMLFVVVLSIMAGFTSAMPAADAVLLDATPMPAPQWFIDAIDDSVENSIGEPILTDSNDNPTTWVAGDTGDMMAIDDRLRYRLYSYEFSHDAVDCATYELSASLDYAADGPDAGAGDNAFMGIVGANVFEGGSFLTPAVGETMTRTISTSVPPEDLREGMMIGYGATTIQRSASDLNTGYTISVPVIDLTADQGACDFDGDGFRNADDPNDNDPCDPDPGTAACLAQTTTSIATTTAAPSSTTAGGSTSSTAAPPTTTSVDAAASPGSTTPPERLAYTGPSVWVSTAMLGAAVLFFGILTHLVARRMSALDR